MTIEQATLPPTAPESVRRVVNDFMNRQEHNGWSGLLFIMGFEADEHDELFGTIGSGDLVLLKYKIVLTEEPVPFTRETLDGTIQDDSLLAVRDTLQRACLLRISEGQNPPLGYWAWNFADDTLEHLGM
jgi:hypothetical protein